MSKTYHHGDLKNSLIRAAREQIEKEGAASLNLRALARIVGVSHPATYRHFANKEALLESVAQQGFEELSAKLSIVTEDELEAQLQALAKAYINFALENPELTRVMFALISADAKKENEDLYVASKNAYGALVKLVEPLGGDTMMNSAVVWSMIHGLAQLSIDKQTPKLNDPKARVHLIEHASAVLAKGLA